MLPHAGMNTHNIEAATGNKNFKYPACTLLIHFLCKERDVLLGMRHAPADVPIDLHDSYLESQNHNGTILLNLSENVQQVITNIYNILLFGLT